MKRDRISRLIPFTVLLLIAIFSVAAVAQEFRGTITGTISDPNGAVVQGATVTVKNVETNIVTTVTTNDSGTYTVPLLQPGLYQVSATSSGFKTSTVENVTVRVDDRLTIDVRLEVGAAAEVNIVADADIIERGSVTTGTLVSQRQIEELPLAEGAPYTLATQAPGVVYTGDPNFQGPTANGNLAGFRTNGAGGNQINLDGSPNLAYDGQVAFTPPSEATQEFKVQTSAFDAQNGFTAGSTVNVAIKSGTNELHGAAYFYDRDKSRTANNFFNNRAGLERPDRKYNRYGVMLNGPVRIPGIFDGRDKTFFLFSYERQKDNVAQPTTYSVPTMLMREGNFSEVLATTPIYDPLSAYMGNATCGTTGTLTQVCRTAFANNVIPEGRIYAPARALLRMFPQPNLPGVTDNFITDLNLQRPYRSYLAKIDHNINANNRISGKWYHSRNTEDRYNLTGEPGSIFQGFENRRNNGGNVIYTSTLTSSLILDVRGSLSQFKLRRYQDGQPSAADLGFTGIPTDRQGFLFPRFDFQNYRTVGSERADWNDGRERPFTLMSIQPTLTQVYGNHTLKYGYDYRSLNEKFFTGGYASGRFNFNGAYTMRDQNSGGTEQNRPGRDLASFLLGIPAGGSIDNVQEYEVSSSYHGMFVHDDFRVTRNLTLNLGIRYDFETGYKEKEGRMIVGFDPTIGSPIAAQARANYLAAPPPGVPIGAFDNLRGGLIFASDADAVNQSADKTNWQPRIGASWAIDSKTVLRGGFGIFTAPFQLITQNVVFQPGFSSPTTFTPTTNSGLTFGATLQNAFPTGINPSPGAAQGLMTFTGRDVIATNAVGPTSFIQSFQRENANYTRFVVGIQREIFAGIGVEATYIYSRGSNLQVVRDINAVPRQYLNDLTGVTDPTAVTTAINNVNTFLNLNVPTNTNPLRGLIPDGGAWNATRILRERLLVPFPQFGYLAVTEYNGKSEYQSLQFQAVKRFTRGLSMNFAYTFSREHEWTRYLNPQDEELTEMVSPTERPHRFTFSGIYELPFGKGRTWGGDWHPVVDGIIGGWQLQGVYEWQSGEPLMFGNVFYNGDPYQLENKLGKKDEQGRRYGIDIPGWDVSGFYLNGIQSTANNNVPAFGNNFQANGTNTLRYFPLTMGQFRNQRFLKFDVGISKNFRIREGMKLQVRVEAINLLNTPYFSAPNLDPANANFGKSVAPVRQPPRDIQIGGRFTF
ncbi:MAG TPA: TonB-dependent receptor [Pyrinomonadaceae bacterium]|nr:TonB-dependent receptor [Pyrinomonadaceae bacterium]